jgi:cystathionine beta-lyase/cystathionine gamma-synthase
VKGVYYPWLDGSPGSAIARDQMRGGGGVVSFELNGGVDAARRFVDALRLIPIATSLGGVETLIEIPGDLDFSPDAPNASGVPAGLLRLSVGLESPGDLIDDLQLGIAASRIPANSST